MKLLPAGCIASLPLLCGGCFPDSRETASVIEVESLRDRVSTLQEEAAKEASESRAARASLRESREEAERREKESAAEREAMKKQLEEVKKAFDEYKAKHRLAARAPGRKFDRMDCGNGHVYTSVEIIEVTPGEMRFSHADGLAKVPLGMVEPSLRDHLDYDPAEAAAWMAVNASKITSDDGQDTEGTAGLVASRSAVQKAVNRKSTASSAGLRKRYQTSLNSLYAEARALQADKNCCPVHKRYQLASWSRRANELKQRIASLPSGD
ncbi:MAG: hypothetical protein V4726_20785 [Verrucomicrobiota bacterium]